MFSKGRTIIFLTGGVPDLVKKIVCRQENQEKIVCTTILKKKNCLHRKLKGKKLFLKQFLKEMFPYDVLYVIWNVCFNTATRDPMDPILDVGPVQGRLRG